MTEKGKLFFGQKFVAPPQIMLSSYGHGVTKLRTNKAEKGLEIKKSQFQLKIYWFL